ncbi:hypothetical protein BGZ83_005290 [Gryganskiella cystojenkinii]|nr:hypothetical protein BGZ83_005290 [Gryganskiella cystojenkinii]
MDSKKEDDFMAFLNETSDEDQDPVTFFEWAGYPSCREGHAAAVWKTTEEWSQRLGKINDKEKDVVVEFQHNRFLKFMDDKNSPFVVKEEPSPPYTPPFPNKRPREAFAGGSESSWEVLTPGDIIDALQEMLPHQRMGEILGVEQGHVFSCVLEDVDVGAHFTRYFKNCYLESYKHTYPEDALALSATLLIKKNSRSPRLHQAFGVQRLTALRESLLQSIVPTLDATLLDKQQALISNADKSSEASRYNKAINQLRGQSKQPDMVGLFTYEGARIETFFGEASSVTARSPFKYGGDTVRLGVFGKNSHDMIENLVDLKNPLLLFNINGLVLQAFVLGKIQDIYTMLEIGTGRIPCSVNDLLFLSQDLPFWLQLREIARKTSTSIEQAVDAGQLDHGRRKSFYPTITTPSAKDALRSSK